jgi:hypothetical protein
MNQNTKYIEPNIEKGITLVALIVTIIILLVLAGITVASLTGDNGLIGKAGEAKNTTERANEKEELEVAVIRFTDKRGNLDATMIVNGLQKEIKNLKEVANTDGKFPVKVEYKNGHKYGITQDGDIIENLIGAGDTAPSDSNAVYLSGKDTAVIPAEFTVSGTEGETSIENGLVVIDQNQNEWVWIPVSSEDLSTLYAEDNIGWIMSGTGEGTATNAIITKYKTTGTQSRGTPGTTSAREPDTVVGSGAQYDATYYSQAGYSSFEKMVEGLSNDYKDMIESIKKYEGFYVGRYELSSVGTQKNQEALTSKNWYQLYKKCREIKDDNDKAVSTMIFGCLWDQVCRFISTAKDASGNTINLTDSRKYGNYNDSVSPANIGNGSKQKTGSNEAWKTNNIYDLAGNCWEWTQEATATNFRIFRSSSYKNSGSRNPVSYREGSYTTYTDSHWSSRPILYIK